MKANEKSLIELKSSIDIIKADYDALEEQVRFIEKEWNNYSFDYEFNAAKEALDALYWKLSSLFNRLLKLTCETVHSYDKEKEVDSREIRLNKIIKEDPVLISKAGRITFNIHSLRGEIKTLLLNN